MGDLERSDTLAVPGLPPKMDEGEKNGGGKRRRPRSPRLKLSGLGVGSGRASGGGSGPSSGSSSGTLSSGPGSGGGGGGRGREEGTPEDPSSSASALFHLCGIADHFTLRGELRGEPGRDVEVWGRRLRKEREIGRGRYGCVDLMTEPETGWGMAVKRIRESAEAQEGKYLEREIRACQGGGASAFLVQCFGVMRLEGDVWICMEVMDASLDRFYRTCEDRELQIPDLVLGRVAFSAVQGLRFLAHQLLLQHRDVKPSNMLISRSGAVKLCDYGVAGTLESEPMAKTINAGHKAYMAPERISASHLAYQAYDERSDVWSLGISLFEIGSGHHPYDSWKNPFQQLRQVVDEPAPKLAAHDPRFSDAFKDFVHTCLAKDYDARPRYDALLQHPFLAHYAQHQDANEDIILRFVRKVLDAIEETIQGLKAVHLSTPSQ